MVSQERPLIAFVGKKNRNAEIYSHAAVAHISVCSFYVRAKCMMLKNTPVDDCRNATPKVSGEEKAK